MYLKEYLWKITLNPIKAGGSESLHKLGGGVPRPPHTPRKRPYRIGIGLKCIFFKANSFKKVRSIIFIVWMLWRVEKNAKEKL